MLSIRLGICLLLLALSSILRAETVIRSEILLGGRSAGEQVTTIADDGRLSVHYAYNDRDWGPDLEAGYRVGADGILVEAEIKGVAYLKTAIDEHYVYADGKASWRNGSESGTAAPAAPAFYLTLEEPPEATAILARALLQAKDHTLSVLPSGSARIEELTHRQFGGQPLTLYAIHGLDLTPRLIWLDVDRQFFATVNEWISVIRDGQAEHVSALLAAQQEIESVAHRARAERLTRRVDGPLLIRNVRVFDPDRGRFVGDSVLLRAGHIVAIGDGLAAPADVQTLDGQGRFLMPGLWDMHVHLSTPIDGLLHLASGITTVRDLANDNVHLARRSADFEAGLDLGPRIIKAGFLDGSGPFAGPTKALADDADTVRAWIDRYAAEGYVQLKIYNSLKKALVPEAIRYAHQQGLRVSGHVPNGMSAREFIELGADELQHINFVFLNFLAGPNDDTRTLLRHRLVIDRGAEIDLTGPSMREFVALLKRKGTVVDPTLVRYEEWYLDQPKMPAPIYAAALSRLPVTWQRRILAGTSGVTAADSRAVMRHRAAYERMIAMVGVLHRAGVPILAGTDAVAGLAYVRELELYVQAGIPPAEVLRIATANAARVMKLHDQRGLLVEGQVADLILVDGDPSRVISDLRRVHTVIRGDRLYDAEALSREAGLAPRE